MSHKLYAALGLYLGSMLMHPAITIANPDQGTLQAIVETGVSRSIEGAQSQQAINVIDEQRRDLESEYAHLAKVVDGIHIYNRVLDKQIRQQQQEIATLKRGITDAAEMERQLIPLLTRMVETLSVFIEMDTPFLITERRFRANELKNLIPRSDVTTAEKMRRVLQAYQIEMDYGRTIEAYRDQIDIDGNLVEADFLRIGRIGLMYQTLDGSKTGAWNQQSSGWNNMPRQRFKQNLKQGLKIARKQVAPAMILSPVFFVESADEGQD